MKKSLRIPIISFWLSAIFIIIVLFSCKKDKTEDVPDSNTIDITTYEVSESGCNYAKVGGTVINNSGYPISQKGICWGLNTLPDISDSFSNEGQGDGEFFSTLTGLVIEMTYYARAYIINSEGIKYGNEISFTTQECIPVTYGGITYNATQIGNQCWMAENLNIGTFIQSTQNQQNNQTIEQYAYNNSTSSWSTYGGLYQWNELVNYMQGSNSNPSGVTGICPPGWHVPSDAEWQELEIYLGMSPTAANSAGWRGTNEGYMLSPSGTTGFNAQYGGFRLLDGSFSDGGCYGFYWTATDTTFQNVWYRVLQIPSNGGEIKRELGGKDFGLAVRCVKN